MVIQPDLVADTPLMDKDLSNYFQITTTDQIV